MTIPPIPSSKELLDIAFNPLQNAANTARKNISGKTRKEKSQFIEKTKLKTIQQRLQKHLKRIPNLFPTIDLLPEYKKELLFVATDTRKLKSALGAPAWANKRITTLIVNHTKEINKTTNLQEINKLRRACIGRVSSIIEQIGPQLELLNEVRKVFNAFPQLNEQQKVICIAGFPNVGKSTLLKKLTGSNVQIADYAFTTKGLNVGKARIARTTLQFIDTPGTLNRQQANDIEKVAHIALKFTSDVVIYVFDPTLPHSLEDQHQLYLKTKRYRKPILTYISKTDITQDHVEDIVKKYNAATTADDLKAQLTELLKTLPQQQ